MHGHAAAFHGRILSVNQIPPVVLNYRSFLKAFFAGREQ